MIPRILSRTLVVFGLVYACFAQQAAPDLQISRKERLEVFSKVWDAVNKSFYDPKFNGVDWSQMKLKYRPQVEAAADKGELVRVLQTMLRELKVSHTSIGQSPFLYTGINFSTIDGRQMVRFVDPKSPAHVAGVESGWLVTNWQGSCNHTGDMNTISFEDSQKRTHQVEVPCDYYSAIPLPDRISRTLDNGAPYIRFPKFLNGTDVWLAEQVRNNRDAQAMVLDLRGNRGGDLNILNRCLGLFLPSGTVFGIAHDRKGSNHRLTVSGSKNPPYQGRVFLMIDEESGSAARCLRPRCRKRAARSFWDVRLQALLLWDTITNFRAPSTSASLTTTTTPPRASGWKVAASHRIM